MATFSITMPPSYSRTTPVAETPPQLDRTPREYFARTLALLDQVGATPTIVPAPLQI